MRVGIIRSDIGHIFLNDVESASQRDFSMQPPGQTRYLHKPSAAEITTVMSALAFLTIQGSNTAATVDTTGANGTKLNIKTSAAASYTQVVVTSNAAVTKTQLVTDLNNQFTANKLALVARIGGTNQITIDTTVGGPTAYIAISASSPSTATFQTVAGLSTTPVTAISEATLSAAVYPTAVTIDVSSATIVALSSYNLLSATAQTNLVSGIANLVAPSIVETGPALLSFAFGEMSKLLSASFQPGGTRAGLTAGAAAYIVKNDGVSVFSL